MVETVLRHVDGAWLSITLPPKHDYENTSELEVEAGKSGEQQPFERAMRAQRAAPRS